MYSGRQKFLALFKIALKKRFTANESCKVNKGRPNCEETRALIAINTDKITTGC
jgi:hypothetical protein